eukprot:gene21323-biopygen16358
MLDGLQNDEPLLEKDIQELKEFVCAVIYKGSKDEGYIDTKVFINSKRKRAQELKRSQLQTKIWLQCGEYQIELLDPEDYGWKWNEETSAVTPVWFTGTQLPPSLQKKKHRQKGYKSDQAAIEGDNDDLSDSPVTNQPRRKKRKKAPTQTAVPIQIRIKVYLWKVTETLGMTRWQQKLRIAAPILTKVNGKSQTNDSDDEWVP